MDHEDLSVPRWHTSSHSGEDECVEVAVTENSVTVRDSWNRSGGQVVFSRTRWLAFVGVLDAVATQESVAGHRT
ncbi:DUF397 domain-containing protein [Streptomyces sp. CWNU-52B]|uniref:DUF397 domain-containing protein n=1 Tax=unclassified Streptomyces TaxID=2593676 RepID=UPI0039BF591D